MMVLRRGGAAPLVVADSGWRWAGLSRAGQLAADGGLPRVMEGLFPVSNNDDVLQLPDVVSCLKLRYALARCVAPL